MTSDTSEPTQTEDEDTRASPSSGLRARVRRLYYGMTPGARRWRLALLVFDLVTITYFVISSMMEAENANHLIDYAIAAVLISTSCGAFAAKAMLAPV